MKNLLLYKHLLTTHHSSEAIIVNHLLHANASNLPCRAHFFFSFLEASFLSSRRSRSAQGCQRQRQDDDCDCADGLSVRDVSFDDVARHWYSTTAGTAQRWGW
jgi:hypothetical protein